MTSSAVVWRPLLVDGQECPLLTVDPWFYARSAAGIMLTVAGADVLHVAAEWVRLHTADGLQDSTNATYWGRAIWIEVPPRTRRARLLEIQHNQDVARLLSIVSDGWTLETDPLFAVPCGRLANDAQTALATVRALVLALARRHANVADVDGPG